MIEYFQFPTGSFFRFRPDCCEDRRQIDLGVLTVKMNNTIKSTLILTLTAFVWGMGFVAQRSGMEYVGPFFFSGARMLLGAGTLSIILCLSGVRARGRDRVAMNGGAQNGDATDESGRAENAPDGGVSVSPGAEMSARRAPKSGNARVLKGGVACGVILFAAGNFQQVGLVVTTASKAGFLTALYIVLVPILGLFLKHKTHWNTWVGVAIAALGLYFLCVTETLDIQSSDFIVLIGALFWAFHILVVDRCVRECSRTDVMKLCVFQFMTSGILSLICSALFDGFFVPEGFGAVDVVRVAPAILYAGILSTGAGFTLQAVGQKYANPSAASIIMSLEAVFSVVGGFLILHERFTGRETLGCVLMFAAVILAQAPVGSGKKQRIG
jgi:drug/metabolite transporter (DMT)-like permease